jgi:hypothetical protein
VDAVVSAGRVHVLQALDPKPHRRSGGAHVNIKVKFFTSARARINCLLYSINFPPKIYPKVSDLEPPVGSGDFVHHLVDELLEYQRRLMSQLQ